MRDVKIKDVPLVESLTGQEKIPVSDGSGSPKAISVQQILDKTPAPDLSEYVKTSDLVTVDLVTEHEYVDLGLPSGTLWATCNVGANSSEQHGLYFAWGETKGYTAEDVINGVKQFNWNDYKFSIDGSSTNFSKYNSVDKLITLETMDDAATVWKKEWKIPTRGNFLELNNYTNKKWTDNYNGVSGMIFESKIDSNKFIFIPAAGNISNGKINAVNRYGVLWTNEYCIYDASYYYEFDSTGLYPGDSPRYTGYTIRPVMSKQPILSNYYTKEEIDSKGYLTEIPEATVDTLGGVKKVQVDSIAEDADITTVVTAYNNLITKLTESGLIVSQLEI